jgi:hypothetical protein
VQQQRAYVMMMGGGGITQKTDGKEPGIQHLLKVPTDRITITEAIRENHYD